MTEGTLPDPQSTLESLDRVTLVTRLQQANERLSFYEAFDETISANVRHSEELMREVIASREATSREGLWSARGPLATLLGTLEADVQDLRARLDRALATIATVRQMLGGDGEPLHGALSTSELTPTTDLDAADNCATNVPEVDSSPRVITVVTHGVTATSQALSLQRHVAGLPGVQRVDTREFAEGVLRLQVSATRDLEQADFADWAEGEPTVRSLETELVELAL